MDTRYRILLVDDVVRYHKVYELAITEVLPAKVHFATNGLEALEILAGPLTFDLLILDLTMPKLGGEETLRRIRHDPTFDTLPVIILTGDTDQETHRRLLDIGADDFVEKGSPPEVFVARMQAQMRHKVALDRLTALAIDMDIFAAGVLHDIRNLETNIQAVCELGRLYMAENPLQRRDLMVSDLQALADKAEGLGTYATEIIRMVRDSHKPFDPQPQDLKPLLEWAAAMATTKQSTPAASRGEAAPAVSRGGAAPAITWEVEGELRPVTADRHFLQLALLNILQNAIKYRRAEVEPRVTIRQRPGRAPALGSAELHRTIVTCIEDNGIGIKQHELRKVFEPFTRGSGSGRRAGGFGLGLSLVQKVMTAMGGRVWAELPATGSGTIMCLELPAANAQSANVGEVTHD